MLVAFPRVHLNDVHNMESTTKLKFKLHGFVDFVSVKMVNMQVGCLMWKSH